MNCIKCGKPTRVKDKRHISVDGRQRNAIRRRRECTVCGARFTTHETFAYVKRQI